MRNGMLEVGDTVVIHDCKAVYTVLLIDFYGDDTPHVHLSGGVKLWLAPIGEDSQWTDWVALVDDAQQQQQPSAYRIPHGSDKVKYDFKKLFNF